MVSHGPPMRGGIATVATDIVEDPSLCSEFEVVFVNTSQNDEARGDFAWANVVRAFGHAARTFVAARRGAVVHTHSVQHPVFVAWRQVAIAAAARARGARVVLHNHGFLPYMLEPGQYSVGTAHRIAFALLDRLADANVLIGEAGVANLRMHMPRIDLPVVHNSVVVGDVPASSGVHDPPVLLFVGELLERKGLAVLLDALDIVDSGGSFDYELRIVGDDTPGVDPERDSMVEQIRGRGRGDCLTGPLPRDEVYREMGSADVFLLPTEYEGQPFTIIEALAAGVPIVASDIPAIASMLDGRSTSPEEGACCDAGQQLPPERAEHGMLVPWGDARGLAEAIQQLLADPRRRQRISASNRELAARSFDRSVFVARLGELYRRYGRPRTSVLRRQRAAGGTP